MTDDRTRTDVADRARAVIAPSAGKLARETLSDEFVAELNRRWPVSEQGE